MNIFESFNTYIDNLFGLEKPISREERQIIGLEVSNAMSAVATLAALYMREPEDAHTPIGEHVEKILLGFSFDGNISDFKLAGFVDPQMSVIKFIAGVSDAFQLWPYILTRSNRPSRRLFSHTVKEALFNNNDPGWQDYVAFMQKRGLQWFGQEDE